MNLHLKVLDGINNHHHVIWLYPKNHGVVYKRQSVKRKRGSRMSYKRLIPCIFIRGGKAVKWFDDPTVVSEDVIALAKEYSDNGADELLVFDLCQDTDQDHDESIELMKRINRVIWIPMVAGGNKCPGVKGLSGMYVSQRDIDCAAFKEKCTEERN